MDQPHQRPECCMTHRRQLAEIRRDRARSWWMAQMVLVLLLGVTGCSTEDMPVFGAICDGVSTAISNLAEAGFLSLVV